MTAKTLVRCTGVPKCEEKDCPHYIPHETLKDEILWDWHGRCEPWSECRAAGPGRLTEYNRVRCVCVKEKL